MTFCVAFVKSAVLETGMCWKPISATIVNERTNCDRQPSAGKWCKRANGNRYQKSWLFCVQLHNDNSHRREIGKINSRLKKSFESLSTVEKKKNGKLSVCLSIFLSVRSVLYLITNQGMNTDSILIKEISNFPFICRMNLHFSLPGIIWA